MGDPAAHHRVPGGPHSCYPIVGSDPTWNPPTHPTERFKDRLVDEGYNPSYGARPLRRAIMRLLEDSMAERMLSGDIKEGDSVIMDGGRVGGGGRGRREGRCMAM